MSKIQVQVSVSKETHELCGAIATLVVALKAKAADGLTLPEIAQAVTENLAIIMTGLSGVEQLPSEFTEDKEAFANAAFLMGTKILGALAKAPVASKA